MVNELLLRPVVAAELLIARGAGVPAAATFKVAVALEWTVMLIGGVVMTGSVVCNDKEAE